MRGVHEMADQRKAHSWYGERKWRSVVQQDPPEDSRTSWPFSVMTYNILADNYAHHFSQWLYRDVPKYALNWEYRLQQLLKEISHWSPDVICMQEVQHYSDLESSLNEAGYHGVFMQRTGRRKDGCAIFWRASYLELHPDGDDPPGSSEMPEGVYNLRFNEMALDDNVALVVRLRARSCSTSHGHDESLGSFNNAVSHQQWSPSFLVATTHILFDPNKGDVKLGQVRELLSKVSKLAERYGVVSIVGGDFNLTPRSPIYNFIQQGNLDVAQHSKTELSGQVKGIGYKHYFATKDILSQQGLEASASCCRCESAASTNGIARHAAFSPFADCLLFGRALLATLIECVRRSRGSAAAGTGLIQHLTSSMSYHNSQIDQGNGLIASRNSSQGIQEWDDSRGGQATFSTAFSTDLVKRGASAGGSEGTCSSGSTITALAPIFEAATSAIAMLSVQKQQQQMQQQQQPQSQTRQQQPVLQQAPPELYKRSSRGRRSLIPQLVHETVPEEMAVGTASTPRSPAESPRCPSHGAESPFEVLSRDISDVTGQGPENNFPSTSDPEGCVDIGFLPIQAFSLPSTCGNFGSPLHGVGRLSFDLRGGSQSPIKQVPPKRSLSTSGSQACGIPPTSTPSFRRRSHTGPSATAWNKRQLRAALGPQAAEEVRLRRDSALCSTADFISFKIPSLPMCSLKAGKPPDTCPPQPPPLATPSPTSTADEDPILAQHPLKLLSSYASVAGDEPLFTSSHHEFLGTCDYIWFTPSLPRVATAKTRRADVGAPSYSLGADPDESGFSTGEMGTAMHEQGGQWQHQLRAIAVLDPPVMEALPQGLPAPQWGSDHICLMTKFEFTHCMPGEGLTTHPSNDEA